jgi:acyl-CoA thioesterase
MYEKDACAQALGIDIIEMDEGYAVVTMTITPQMLNGHKTCHGGQLFSLADTAFAYACNSQGLAAVASGCSIDFLRPGFAGDTLTATARVKHQGKLTGVYDIEIQNQQQKTSPFSRKIAPHWRQCDRRSLMRDAFICDGVRTPVGRYGGALSAVRADDLGAVPLRALLARYPQLDLERIDDVILGCANQAGKTTATWRACRPCWRDCRRRFPAPPLTACAVRGWTRLALQPALLKQAMAICCWRRRGVYVPRPFVMGKPPPRFSVRQRSLIPPSAGVL